MATKKRKAPAKAPKTTDRQREELYKIRSEMMYSMGEVLLVISDFIHKDDLDVSLRTILLKADADMARKRLQRELENLLAP